MTVDLEKKYKQLLYHVQTQQQVLMTSSMLHKNFGVDEVSKVITDTLIEFVGAVSGLIYLKKNGDHSRRLELSSFFGFDNKPLDDEIDFGIIELVAVSGRSVYSEADKKAEFNYVNSPDKKYFCKICIPLRSVHGVIGVVGIVELNDRRSQSSFERNYHFYNLLATQAASAFEASFMHRKIMRELRADVLEEENRKLSSEIEHRKEVEIKLQNEQKKAVALANFKSEFLANMSHEIRTPLNAVIGMASLLEITPLNDEQKEFTGAIRSSGAVLLNIINDILDFSKIEAGQMTLNPEPFDFLKVISDVVEMFSEQATKKNLLIYSYVDPGLSCLDGDHLRIRQIFLNLVGNAIKFTQSGYVSITAKTVKISDRFEIFCQVKDTGCGIPLKDQPDIFASFKQTSKTTEASIKGTGLGLAIAKRLCESMGGHISLSSEEGKGTCFSFTLKLPDSDSAESRMDLCRWTKQLSGKNLLLLGDSVDSDNPLMLQLKSWGINVSRFEFNGQNSMTGKGQVNFDYFMIDSRVCSEKNIEEFVQVIDGIAPLSAFLYVGSKPKFDALLAGGLFSLYQLIRTSLPVSGYLLRERLVNSSSGKLITEKSDTSVYVPSFHSSQENLKILFVDDNSTNRDLGKLYVTKCGHIPILAESGEMALEMLSIHNDISMVFMDCRMPGLDGFETTLKVREIERSKGGHLIIVALTASVIDTEKNKCIESGMDGFYEKPMTLKKFRSALETWLPKKTA